MLTRSTLVLLNLLNEKKKSEKKNAKPAEHLISFGEFNKINDTGARMLDSFSHMTLKQFVIPFCSKCKRLDFAI